MYQFGRWLSIGAALLQLEVAGCNPDFIHVSVPISSEAIADTARASRYPPLRNGDLDFDILRHVVRAQGNPDSAVYRDPVIKKYLRGVPREDVDFESVQLDSLRYKTTVPRSSSPEDILLDRALKDYIESMLALKNRGAAYASGNRSENRQQCLDNIGRGGEIDFVARVIDQDSVSGPYVVFARVRGR